MCPSTRPRTSSAIGSSRIVARRTTPCRRRGDHPVRVAPVRSKSAAAGARTRWADSRLASRRLAADSPTRAAPARDRVGESHRSRTASARGPHGDHSENRVATWTARTGGPAPGHRSSRHTTTVRDRDDDSSSRAAPAELATALADQAQTDDVGRRAPRICPSSVDLPTPAAATTHRPAWPRRASASLSSARTPVGSGAVTRRRIERRGAGRSTDHGSPVSGGPPSSRIADPSEDAAGGDSSPQPGSRARPGAPHRAPRARRRRAHRAAAGAACSPRKPTTSAGSGGRPRRSRS